MAGAAPPGKRMLLRPGAIMLSLISDGFPFHSSVQICPASCVAKNLHIDQARSVYFPTWISARLSPRGNLKINWITWAVCSWMLGPYTPGRGLGDRLRKVTRLQRPLTRRFPLLKAPTQTLTRNWKSLTVSIHRLRKCLRNSWLRRELTQAYATLKNTGFEATCLGSLWPLAGAIFPAVQLSQVVQVVRADDERVPSLRTGSLSLVYPRWS